MPKKKFKYHVFDELIRLATILMLVLFSIFLIFIKSDLARDIVLLVIGVIGGRYMQTQAHS